MAKAKPDVASSSSPSPTTTSSAVSSSRPMLTLPPRSSMESFFTAGGGCFGASPGPMTLVSNFFSDTTDPTSDCRSFSQLLAMAPSPSPGRRPPPIPSTAEDCSTETADLRFKMNRPSGLMVTHSQPVFTVPHGLSPTCLLDSPAFFSGSQSPFGISHQQALAQVTAQAAQAHYMQIEAEHTFSSSGTPMSVPPFTSTSAMHQQTPSLASDATTMVKESLENSQSHQRSQPTSFSADKPVEDGYNWRKYGQKQVKGSEYPRSYYKCTHPNCPVKKKVEHSADGQVTEIIYKGQHIHPLPQPNKRSKDTGNLNGNSSNWQANPEFVSKEEVSASLASKMDHESSRAKPEHLSGSSGSEEVADNETREEERDEDEPDSKRRNVDDRFSEPASSHQTVTEPRIIVQTTSEVDLLDDGYRWRKYGQKVVKGNPNPRSYYKCTNPGCNVRKHVERAATDPKAVITTYEGKHKHDVPTAKNSSRGTANSDGSLLKPDGMAAGNGKHALIDRATGIGGNNQQPIALLQLKEEQAT